MKNLQLRLETFVAIIVTVVLLGFGVSPAYAVGFTPSYTTTNGVTQVGATSDGRLAWSNDGATWNEVSSPLKKNGVSSVSYANGYFIASSFFTAAYSTNGQSWTEFTIPVGEKFNPGNIISDSEFFTAGSMSATAIQQFIESKNTYCVSGYTCLPQYRETTWSRDATPMCKAYTGGFNESAATIIAKVSTACGVSAEVLLVLLQKEQSLLTSSAPSQGKYNTATGYACPDTAACDAEYFGFYNQVYNAAKQYKRYSNPAGTSNYFTWYPVGRTTNVRWSPNADCGASPVYIENQATAGLYYYTPYQPNAASLQAWNGLGDSCSAYGNRNFWRLYNIWFNTEMNYKTFVAGVNGNYVAVDADGTVAKASNLGSWTLNMNPIGNSSKITSLAFSNVRNQYEAKTSNSNLMYVSSDGSSWASATPVTGVNEPAITPTTPVVDWTRTVGVYNTNRRPAPNTSATADATQLKPNQTVTISGWITGQNVDGIDVWYKLAGTELYSWSGGFTSQSIEGITNLNPNAPAPAPAPVVTPTVAPTVTPEPAPSIIAPEPVTKITPVPEVKSEPVPVTPVDPKPSIIPTITPSPTPTVIATPKPSTTPTPAPTVTPTPTSIAAVIHTVVSGDTVWALSSKYGTTVANIVAWNSLPNNGSLIYVGQKLIVKPASVSSVISNPTTTAPKVVKPTVTKNVAKYYRIQKGDTLALIAQKTKTTVTQITKLNSASSLTNLVVGKNIRYQ